MLVVALGSTCEHFKHFAGALSPPNCYQATEGRCDTGVQLNVLVVLRGVVYCKRCGQACKVDDLRAHLTSEEHFSRLMTTFEEFWHFQHFWVTQLTHRAFISASGAFYGL